MKGPTSFQASYFDRHMPFTYTHTPNGKWIKKFKNVSAFLFFEKKIFQNFRASSSLVTLAKCQERELDQVDLELVFKEFLVTRHQLQCDTTRRRGSARTCTNQLPSSKVLFPVVPHLS